MDGPSLLCGMVKPIGVEELVASLPPKISANKLIVRFFDERDSPMSSLRKPLQSLSLLSLMAQFGFRHATSANIHEAGTRLLQLPASNSFTEYVPSTKASGLSLQKQT